MKHNLQRAPKKIERERKPIDLKAFKRRSADEADFSELISEPVILHEPGQEKPSVIYLELTGDFSDLVDALKEIDFVNAHRTDGMQSMSKIFGNQPRIGFRRPWCSQAALGHESPEEHSVFLRYMSVASKFYSCYHPEMYQEHADIVNEKIIEDWRIQDSVFTSGIANKNNPLPYHYDKGNFPGVWSNMFCFKYGVSGGYLSVPEYDVGFKLNDKSLLMFNGQDLLHGVTPIQKHVEDAYRFTVVFYALRQMWKCLPPEEELAHARAVRTKRERDRYQRIKDGTEVEHRKQMLRKAKGTE